jgi:hypothetical protein
MFVTQEGHRRNCNHVYSPGSQIDYEEGQSIFVKTDFIREFFHEFRGQKRFVLVSGLSDYSPSTFFTDQELFKLLENPLLIEWRAQNVCTEHPKLKHIPIGLEDTQSKLDFCEKYSDELKQIPKMEKVYTNFSPDTNPHERENFVSHSQKTDFETYMKDMARYKYVLCPMGNGIDTHRFWEAQVCGCIPIVRCPKEFLPTYKNVPYICLPGLCFARLGHPYIVHRRESIFMLKNYPSIPV